MSDAMRRTMIYLGLVEDPDRGRRGRGCVRCGALVAAGFEELHERWHARLERR